MSRPGRSAERGLPYVPYAELGGRPHVVVDGAPRPGTVLTISHWPGTPSPRRWRRDLSAEMALLAIATPRRYASAEAVTVDHFDQDGLVSLFCLVAPTAATGRSGVLVEVARVGDFAVVRDRRAARTAFALAALAPVGQRAGRADWTEAEMGKATAAALEMLPAIVDAPDHHRSLWGPEDACYEEGLAALSSGRVQLDEDPRADLAVFVLEEPLSPRDATRLARPSRLPIHPAVLHGATRATRILVAWPGHYLCYQRYETWVRYVSSHLVLRRDLGALAERLSAEESDDVTWTAEPVNALEPFLSHDGESSLALDRVVASLAAHLVAAPPAWDPQHDGGPPGHGARTSLLRRLL